MSADELVHRKTVVIADDTAFVRDRFASVLEEAGLRAIAVGTTAELLACLRAPDTRVDLILIDLQLPPARGVGLARAVRERAGPDLPIVVLSGTVASADEVRELAAVGIAGYINEYSATQHILASLAPHLFPEKFDRRGSPRVVTSISVSYRTGQQIASGLTMSLGKGGIGIRSMNPLAFGVSARLRFRLPGEARDVEADATVCWADRHLGMGLQFERLSEADQAVIDDFVERHVITSRRVE